MSIEGEVSKGLLHWAKGQPFNNVVVVLQLLIMAAVAWYGITKLVPGERAAITAFGVSLEENHTKQVERITETYEKMLDRVSGKEPERAGNGAIVGK